MALVVEDGTAKANSNAYDSVANCQTYYTDMGYSDTPTEATLIRGSRFADRRHRTRLAGFKVTSGQAMAWPRWGVTDEDGNVVASDAIPDLWKHAVFEYARTVSTDMVADTAQRVKAVGAGSARVEFASAKEIDTIRSHADGLVSQYMESRAGRVVRA